MKEIGDVKQIIVTGRYNRFAKYFQGLEKTIEDSTHKSPLYAIPSRRLDEAWIHSGIESAKRKYIQSANNFYDIRLNDETTGSIMNVERAVESLADKIANSRKKRHSNNEDLGSSILILVNPCVVDDYKDTYFSRYVQAFNKETKAKHIRDPVYLLYFDEIVSLR